MQIKLATERLQGWMINNALPLWIDAGFDHSSGSAYEQLLKDGTPDITCDKRIRVQARQMFVFSVAADRGWIDCGQDRVERIQTFLNTFAKHPEQSAMYIHKLTHDNQPSDTKQDTYDLAFILLSCAGRFRAFKDSKAIEQANTLADHLDNELKGENGGWLEGNCTANIRRQNPHMHLLEAFIALFDATQDAQWLLRAGEVFTLFEKHFFDRKNGVLLEYFHPDWTPLTDTEGQAVEPGHMLEWVWLLHTYSARTGINVKAYTDALYQNAITIGKESASGLLFDECRIDGSLLKQTKRCWPLTELIKASVMEAKTGNIRGELTAAKAIDTLFTYYLSQNIAGAYADQLDDNNQLINDKAPASTLYHLLMATTEVIDYVASLCSCAEQ